MRSSFLRRGAQIAASLAGLAALALAALPANAAPFDGRRNQFADSAFGTVWRRTDDLNVRGGRSWYWGPGAWFDYAEFYRQSPNGLRTVQYFDKARMEINDPANRSFQGGVTNGLLVVELVSGQLKRGNDPYDFDTRQAADVPVAGNPKNDNPNSPTYASFAGVATVNNGYRDANKLNQRVGTTIDKGGNLSFRQDLADAHPETEIVQYNSITGHNIPRVLWDFLNLQGPFVEGGAVRRGTIVDWTFAMGLPISDAYWTRARVGAAEKDVLVQLFERRVLTYTPDNPAGFKVEMGNVGQHYFQWRYAHLGTPWAAPDPTVPPLFALDEGKDHWELAMYQIGAPGNWWRITDGSAETVPYSYRRSWDPSKTRVLVDSRRSDGQHRQIYELDVPMISGGNELIARRLTYSDGQPVPPGAPCCGWLPNGSANDYNPSISPDGTKIVFVSDREGVPQLYLMTADGQSPNRLSNTGCVDQVPSWSPNGRSLYWESQCSGQKVKIVAADLAYNEDSSFGTGATLVNIRELTAQAQGDNRFPRVAPDGQKVVFTSYRDGNAEIYTMNADGSQQTRLTSSGGEDEAASWSPNGQQLLFASNRDGNYNLYLMNADGSSQAQQTSAPSNERWVLWAQ
jgi:hypothetical protein